MIILEKYKKEKLTIGNIKTDYKTILKARIKTTVISLAYTLPLLALSIVWFINVASNNKILVLPFVCLFLLCFYATLYLFAKDLIYSKIISNKKFKIAISKLNNGKTQTFNPASGIHKPHILTFEKYGIYTIPQCVNYSSSRNFQMNDIEVFNTSKKDDEFYIVLSNNNKPILAYNTKFFELNN